MNLKKPILSQVKIMGLHGDRNIVLNFSSPIKILVDENGSGKSTFLNILVGLLQGKWNIVNRYNFKEVQFKVNGMKPITFTKDELMRNFPYFQNPEIIEILSNLPNNIVNSLIDDVLKTSYEILNRKSNLLAILSERSDVPPRRIYDLLRREPLLRKYREKFSNQTSLFEIDETSNMLANKMQRITEVFPYKVLYFPTYRLVEENLQILGYDTEIKSRGEQLIQFGMTDVRKHWDDITENIRNSSLQWFAKINGKMLDELSVGIRSDSIDYESIQQPKALEIVLARSGNNIQKSKRTRILELVKSGEIKKEEYTPLAYFLSNLIKIYEMQRETDEAIKKFVSIVNGYLTDKEIVYDETEMNIEVVNLRSNVSIQLDKLSSGEKQILSIFTRLYLELDNPKQYAIFFDEPELSLSMEWQKKLLKDITDSTNCAFLLAATHSPFIFDNELAPFADILSVEYLGE